MTLPIVKMLNISTGHVSKETADLLNGNKLDDVWTIPHEYGWIVFVSEYVEKEPVPQADMQQVLVFARKHGCDYIKFDCDASLIDELPKYSW